MKVLYRYFGKEEYRDRFLSGKILMRSVNYYKCSKQQQGDSEEFAYTYPGGGSTLCNDSFILCFSEELSEELMEKFGRHVVKIENPLQCFQSLKKTLSPILMGPQLSNFGKVCYYAKEDFKLENILHHNGFSSNGAEDPVNNMFRKRGLYAAEQEHRMVFTPSDLGGKFETPIQGVRFKFYKHILHSSGFCRKYNLPASTVKLNDNQMDQFLRMPDNSKYFEFDSIEDWRRNQDDFESWNYGLEFYMEAHIVDTTLSQYLSKM